MFPPSPSSRSAGTTHTVPLTGLVLAGGLAQRFGGNKLVAAVGTGERVIDRTVMALRGVAGLVVVVGGQQSLGAGDVWMPDAQPPSATAAEGAATRGPLAGIVAGMEFATTPLVAVVAGDMPLASAAVLAQLARAWQGEPAVIPVVKGKPQPLHAVYATRHTGDLRTRFDAGERSPLRVARSIGARFEEVDDSHEWMRDIDTRADLADVLAAISRAPDPR